MWHRIQFPIVNAIFGVSRRYEIRTTQVMLPATLIGPRVGPKMRVTVDACTSAAPICAGKHHGIGGWSFHPITYNVYGRKWIQLELCKVPSSSKDYEIHHNVATSIIQLLVVNFSLTIIFCITFVMHFVNYVGTFNFFLCVRWVFCMANMWVD